MKKYSSLLVLLVLTSLTFVIYYQHVQQLSKTFPVYQLHTIEGEPELIEDLIIKGDYHLIDSHGEVEAFFWKGNETYYWRDAPYKYRLHEVYYSEKLRALYRDYSSFMRMKESNDVQYIEKNGQLIYASLPHSRWGIFEGVLKMDLYDKEKKETKQFEQELNDSYEYAYIEQVFTVQDLVYVALMEIEYLDDVEGDRMQFRLLPFDLGQEKWLDPIILPLDQAEHSNDQVKLFLDDEADPTELVLASAAVHYDEEKDLETIAFLQVQMIDLASKTVRKLSLDDPKMIGTPIGYNGKELVLAKIGDQGIHYLAYDLGKDKVSEKFSLDPEIKEISFWDFDISLVKGNTIYSLLNRESGDQSILIVIDMASYEVLYLGQLESEPSLQDRDNEEVFFHSIEFEYVAD